MESYTTRTVAYKGLGYYLFDKYYVCRYNIFNFYLYKKD